MWPLMFPLRRLLALRLASGRRVQLQLSQPHQVAGLRTGMRLEVTGRWAQQQLASGAAGVAAAAATASSSSSKGSSSSQRFVATSIRASGGKVAVPKLIQAAAVSSPGGGVAAAAAITVAPIVRSSNQLVSNQVNAIFIPSELQFWGWTHCSAAETSARQAAYSCAEMLSSPSCSLFQAVLGCRGLPHTCRHSQVRMHSTVW